MRRSSPVPYILVALAGLVVFGYANNSMFHSGSHPDAEEANQAAQQALDARQHKNVPPQPAAKQAPGTDMQPLITELTVGNPATAKQRITLGYSATGLVAQSPRQVNALVATLQDAIKAMPQASLQVVCLDIPLAERQDKSTAGVPHGLARNGKVIFNQLPDTSAVQIPPPALAAALQAGTKG